MNSHHHMKLQEIPLKNVAAGNFLEEMNSTIVEPNSAEPDTELPTQCGELPASEPPLPAEMQSVDSSNQHGTLSSTQPTVSSPLSSVAPPFQSELKNLSTDSCPDSGMGFSIGKKSPHTTSIQSSRDDPSRPLLVGKSLPNSTPQSPAPTSGNEMGKIPDENAYGATLSHSEKHPRNWLMYVRMSFLPLLALFSFSLLTFSNALNWLTYAPLSDLSTVYHIDSMQVNMLSLVYMFIYPVGAPVASFAVAATSGGIGLLVGALLNTIGTFLRYASIFFTPAFGGSASTQVTAYAMLLTGQIFCSVSQCFIIGVPPLIANRYFPPSLRPLVTALGVFCNCAGIGFAFLASPLASVIGLDWYQLLWAILASVSTVLILFFVVCSTDFLYICRGCKHRKKVAEGEPISATNERAPTKQSQDHTIQPSTVVHDDYNTSFAVENSSPKKQALRKFLFNLLDVVRPFLNVPFLLLCVSFGVSMGSVWAIATVIAQLIEPLGYNDTDTAIVGVTNVVCGMAGILSSGILGSIFAKHMRTLLKLFYILSTLSMIFFAFALRPDARVWLVLSQVFLGFSTSGVIPLSLELAAEVIYPVDEAIGANHQLVAGNAIAIGLVIMVDQLNQKGKGVLSVWIMAILCSVACVLSFFYVGRYKRREHEKKLKETVVV